MHRTFQSTLPRRERQRQSQKSWNITNFNPRSRGGSDTKAIFIETLGNPISIHAPAEGATCRLRHHIKGGKFQSTLPRRERPTCICKTSPIRYFNPRSRGGSDNLPVFPQHLIVHISIHAPAEGATCIHYICGLCKQYFNPRSRGGSDDIADEQLSNL